MDGSEHYNRTRRSADLPRNCPPAGTTQRPKSDHHHLLPHSSGPESRLTETKPRVDCMQWLGDRLPVVCWPALLPCPRLFADRRAIRWSLGPTRTCVENPDV